MMRTTRVLTMIGCVTLARCGGDVQSTPIGQVPSEPSGPQTATHDTSTFAIDALFVGDTGFDGKALGTAWESFGYNLDGLTTTRTSTNVCTSGAGTQPIAQIDGLGGIDNTWGAFFLSDFAEVATSCGFFSTGCSSNDGSEFGWMNPSKDATSFIQSGVWTLEIQVTGLSTDLGQTATGLDAQVFVGANVSSFAGQSTTNWPVLPSSLADGATIAGGARVHFATSYVTDGTIVAKDSPEPLVVPLVFSNGGGQLCLLGSCTSPVNPPVPTPLTLRIHNPTLTFTRSDVSTAMHGIIAGVLDANEFANSVLVAQDLGPGATCNANDRATIANNVTQFLPDILLDGTNASGVPCDAISIGLGFTAKLFENPTTIGVDAAPPADPCTSN